MLSPCLYVVTKLGQYCVTAKLKNRVCIYNFIELHRKISSDSFNGTQFYRNTIQYHTVDHVLFGVSHKTVMGKKLHLTSFCKL